MSALGKYLASGGKVEVKPTDAGDDDGHECTPEMKLAMYEFLSVAGFGSVDSERCEKACKAFHALCVICCE